MDNESIATLCMLAGLFLLVYGKWWQRRLRKYEFENRSDGGVIGFKSFGDAEAHKWKHRIADFVGGIGIILFVGGCVYFA